MKKELLRKFSKFVILSSSVLLFGGSIVASNLPFPIGEELTYTISWNGIPVAQAISTTEMDTLNGREVIALRMRTKTYAFFNKVFRVEDFHESLVDPKTFLPIRYTKNLKEGSYRCHEVTTFDFMTKKAHYEHQLKEKKKIYDINSDTRDILSFMYFMRSESLAENKNPTYRMMADEKLYDLILHTYGIDKIDLPNYDDKVPSLKMFPEAMFDGLFVRKGKATVWVSRDPRRLVTFIKAKVAFGRVRIKLQSVNGPGDDFWITEKNDEK